MTSMFTVDQVTKTYNGDPALEGVSFRVKRGERVAVLGPSGSGKTTLLHVLGGVVTPRSGSVEVRGRPLRDIEPGRELARYVGIMHQQFDLVDELPVIHNVLAGRLGEWSLLESLWSLLVPRDRERAREALARVGIEDKIHEKTAHLSGGEQQRVALARLLVQHPQAILADEPVASVDPARARNLIETLFSVTREENLTLLTSLHSVSLALEFFPRVIALRQGRVLFDKATDDIEGRELDTLYELENAASPG